MEWIRINGEVDICGSETPHLEVVYFVLYYPSLVKWDIFVIPYYVEKKWSKSVNDERIKFLSLFSKQSNDCINIGDDK